MAKKQSLKRVIAQTKKGPEARYYIDGKRVSAKKGAARFIRENFETLTNPWRKSQLPLLPKEQKTLKNVQSQKELFRYKGRPIRKTIVDVMLQKGFLDPKGPRELTQVKLPSGAQQWKSYGAFEQIFERLKEDFIRINTTLMGAPGFRDRQEATGIVKIQDTLNPLRNDGWKFVLIDQDGNEVKGYKTVLSRIMDYEIDQTGDAMRERIDVAAVQFVYQMKYEWNEKVVTIRLQDAQVVIMTSDPSKRTPVNEPVKQRKIKRKKRK